MEKYKVHALCLKENHVGHDFKFISVLDSLNLHYNLCAS